MNGLDTSAIAERLAVLNECEAVLRDLAGLSIEEIMSDAVKLYALEHAVQLAAQAAIDVGNHLIAALGWRAPKDYADVFQVLKQEGALSSELASRLSGLAGLRNILVHLYLKVDVERLLHDAVEGVEDLARFGQEIAHVIESYQASSG